MIDMQRSDDVCSEIPKEQNQNHTGEKMLKDGNQETFQK